MSTPRRQLFGFLIALLSAGQACSLGGAATTAPVAQPEPGGATAVAADPTQTSIPPTETSVPATPTVVHLVTPGAPGAEQFFLADVASGGDNSVQRATAGDNYARNRLERPFTTDLTYRSDLDLVHAGISADDIWYYFHLDLFLPPAAGALPATYAVEFDLEGDGRGDLLVRAAAPGATNWTTDGVQIWSDANDDVGGDRPMESDPAGSRDGFETLVFNQGVGADPDSAWVRLSPKGIQIAVMRSVVDDQAFLWGAWADDGINQPGWIDYNDHFSADQAGSLSTALGTVFAVDNTCRMYFGYTPSGSEPGLCAVTGTVRNCTPHPIRMEPGGKMLTPWFEAAPILKNVQIGSYSFYDESTGGTLVLTASLSPGGTITITKTGLGDTYACQ